MPTDVLTVETDLAAVAEVSLADLLDLQHVRPVLAAEISRVRDQARQDEYRYSAFGSFVGLPPTDEKGTKTRGSL